MGGFSDCGTHRACDNNIKSAVVKKQVLRLLSTVSVFATKTPGFNILKNVFLCGAINLLCGLLYFPFFFFGTSALDLSIGSQPPPLPRRSQVFVSRGVGWPKICCNACHLAVANATVLSKKCYVVLCSHASWRFPEACQKFNEANHEGFLQI